ncbi:MAG TPA: hypothetical protein VN678_09080 [Acidobacteriaceae bacterium]|nr:hypothetical protein [Acidobacteriaceae bacterium]
MTTVLAESVSQQDGDAPRFIDIVQNIASGLVHEQQPKRLYVIRIDNWFGPKWLSFAGKFSVGGYIGRRMGIGVHKQHLHVPPFVPTRVISERVFTSPNFGETAITSPLHIECPSKVALKRRIEDVDNDAIFVWFSCESEVQKRGAVMIYSTAAFSVSAQDFGFYVGFAETDDLWQPAMLRGVSREEIEGLQQLGQA